MGRPRTKFRAWAELPAERTPPFLLHDGADLVLISPFAKRVRPSASEVALVQTVAGHLRSLTKSCGSVWIDPETGRTTPAAIGEGQVRRKLFDCASFNVRMP